MTTLDYTSCGLRSRWHLCSLLFFISTMVVTNTFAQETNTESESSEQRPRRNLVQENATMHLFRDLLKDYDKRIRPYFATGQAVTVTVDFYLSSFDSIRESHMDYTVTLYLRQHWHDPRLEYDSSLTLPYTSHYVDDIWLPDLIITNAKKASIPDVTIPNRWVHINSSGHVLYNMRLNLQLSCAMDFHRFPMDGQSCEMDLESFENPIEDVRYEWNEEEPVEYHLDLLKLPQYEVDGVHTHGCSKELRTGVYSCIGADFLFRRTLGYYLLQTYIPSTLLVVTSWVSFWIHVRSSPARVALGVTTILTMITTNNGVRADLPKVSYIKAIDIWFAACFFFVIGALVEFAMAHYLSFNKSPVTLCREWRKDSTDNTDTSLTSAVKMGSQTCMVLTIEDSPEDDEEDIGVIVEEAEEYSSNERRTPEADQDRSYTNYGAPQKKKPPPSKLAPEKSGKKLCIKGRCRSKVHEMSKSSGNPIYHTGKRIDRICRVLFPLGFVAFNIGYWSYYIEQAEDPTHGFEV